MMLQFVEPAASDPAVMEQPSDKLFCCQWVRDRVPQAHREELYHILRMTGPLVRSSAITKIRGGAYCSLQYAGDKIVLFKMSGGIDFVSELQKQKGVSLK